MRPEIADARRNAVLIAVSTTQGARRGGWLGRGGVSAGGRSECRQPKLYGRSILGFVKAEFWNGIISLI